MKKTKTIFPLFILILFFSCAKDSINKKDVDNKNSVITSKNTSTQNLNISFLLDLSDRINPQKYPNESMEFYQRDIAYIKSVSEAFDTHLRNKRVRQMNDKIQLFFDPAPLNENINKISNQLKYNVYKDNINLELLDNIKETYTKKPIEIYDLAIKDNSYVGSDTWRFFKNKIKDFCIEDDHRNILVILTDGYIFHKNTQIKEDNYTSYLTPQIIRKFRLNSSNWEEKIEKEKYGFIPATDHLESLEILVLGINPDKKNSYEQDVIVKYWSNWFKSMKVIKYNIKSAGLPSNMDKIIKDFILAK
ncbi:hypothetical protein [Polaribacter porphyrae]|uniref:VWFA domain-containing protein n=1 Tax=Polaribacter porphyrae TaxID=1137780 RepID=A0A2S7WTR1_9FLAO|nr:hypothetical protein [Polaribacter porphyrae]PQJ80866.1 hypothetical protein BTO18_01800 [Polaribacter porphyrae]